MAFQTVAAISKIGAISNVMAIQTTGAISKFGPILNVICECLGSRSRKMPVIHEPPLYNCAVYLCSSLRA